MCVVSVVQMSKKKADKKKAKPLGSAPAAAQSTDEDLDALLAEFSEVRPTLAPTQEAVAVEEMKAEPAKEEDDDGAGDADDKIKKKKKKKKAASEKGKKEDDEAQSPKAPKQSAPGKLVAARMRALREEEERLEALRREEEERIKELERKEEEERQRIQEEKERKRKAKKDKIDRQKKEGTYKTKAEKERER
jgi:hypothetical protein